MVMNMMMLVRMVIITIVVVVMIMMTVVVVAVLFCSSVLKHQVQTVPAWFQPSPGSFWHF